MSAALKNMIGLSFLSGVGLYLCPEGMTKRVLTLLCTAILLAAILAPLRELDVDLLSLGEAQLSSAEAEILQAGQESEDTLRKLTMQRNCERYIENTGAALGLENISASVELRRTESGEWLPYAAVIRGSGENAIRKQLSRILSEELGIPGERQAWLPDG